MGEVLLARDSLEEVVDSVSEKILLDIPPGGFKTLKISQKLHTISLEKIAHRNVGIQTQFQMALTTFEIAA